MIRRATDSDYSMRGVTCIAFPRGVIVALMTALVPATVWPDFTGWKVAGSFCRQLELAWEVSRVPSSL